MITRLAQLTVANRASAAARSPTELPASIQASEGTAIWKVLQDKIPSRRIQEAQLRCARDTIL